MVSSRRKQLCIQWSIVLLSAAVGSMLAVLSIARYVSYSAAMEDLGNMSQAIWSATQGKPLLFTNEDVSGSRLAGHVELIYFLLTPFYRLFPTPITLVTIQAMLFACGAVPLYALSRQRFKSHRIALVLSAIYLFYPVAQNAVLFDFHGDTLGMSMLLFAIQAKERRDWFAYGVWIALALSCKFYVAAPVAALGLLFWLRGERRVGGVTAVIAVIWGLLLVLVVRPYFAIDSSGAVSRMISYTDFYFGTSLFEFARSLPARCLSASLALLPVIPFLKYSSGWLLPALAIIVPVFFSSGPGAAYSYANHHYALSVPFIVMAMVGSLDELYFREIQIYVGKKKFLVWPLALGISLLLTLSLNAIVVHAPISWAFGIIEPYDPSSNPQYYRTSRDKLKDRWLSQYVPPSEPLGASLYLAPHLTHRRVLITASDITPHMDVVMCGVYDALFDQSYTADMNTLRDAPAIRAMIQDPRFSLVGAQDGLLFFTRSDVSEGVLFQMAHIADLDSLSYSVYYEQFAEAIALINVDVEALGGRRYRLYFDWLALDSLVDRAPLFAVSRLVSVEDARFVHIPTQVLFSTTSWPEDKIVKEVFDIELPSDLAMGSYRLVTGWYDSAHPEAYATDSRSRLGDEVHSANIDFRNIIFR